MYRQVTQVNSLCRQHGQKLTANNSTSGVQRRSFSAKCPGLHHLLLLCNPPPLLLPFCLQSPSAPIVFNLSTEVLESSLQPCLSGKIILPPWYSCCVLIRGSGLSILSASDLMLLIMMTGRNALTSFHVSLHFVPALDPRHLLFN